MADLEDEKCDPEEILIQRHRKERKSHQAEVQKLKHGVAKGDKKKKKEIAEKIAVLEAEIDARHEKEIAELKNQTSAPVCKLEEPLKQLRTEDGDEVKQANKPKKLSKAQKKRDKKAAQDQERDEQIREQEIENLTSSRNVESIKIKKILSERGLQIHEIPSDGNCLYVAVSHQLSQRNIESSNEKLRKQVADYMRDHQDDFIPFLSKDNGDCYSTDDFEEYCKQTESTPAWGGQLEIQALSNILKSRIEVVQSEGPSIVTGEEHGDEAVVLTYYRHAYGLGEHYHSVENKTEEKEDEFT